jgi:hypothetical protein
MPDPEICLIDLLLEMAENQFLRCLFANAKALPHPLRIQASQAKSNMIHSSIIDHWNRVKIMHSVAQDFYDLTRASEYRNRKRDMSEGFFFDAKAFEIMQKEVCIVEMIMAWCVITLESQINHALAETIRDKDAATQSIEHPEGSKENFSLAKKLLILSNDKSSIEPIIKIANELSLIRNTIIHDKPFDLIDRGEGDVEVQYFQSRGNANGKQYRFEELAEFYKKCQIICDFVDSHFIYDFPNSERVHFHF